MSPVQPSLVRAREGGSAELECNLAPTSKEGASPNLFPLHVVEWVRLGYNVPVLIKFGVYAPRVHPNYKGKHLSKVLSLALTSLPLMKDCLADTHEMTECMQVFCWWTKTKLQNRSVKDD